MGNTRECSVLFSQQTEDIKTSRWLTSWKAANAHCFRSSFDAPSTLKNLTIGFFQQLIALSQSFCTSALGLPWYGKNLFSSSKSLPRTDVKSDQPVYRRDILEMMAPPWGHQHFNNANVDASASLIEHTSAKWVLSSFNLRS